MSEIVKFMVMVAFFTPRDALVASDDARGVAEVDIRRCDDPSKCQAFKEAYCSALLAALGPDEALDCPTEFELRRALSQHWAVTGHALALLTTATSGRAQVALELLGIACKAKDALACERLTNLTSGDARDRMIQRACSLEGRFCLRFATESVDPKKALQLLQYACSANVARGCHEAGLLAQRLNERTLPIEEYFRKACQLGRKQACASR